MRLKTTALGITFPISPDLDASTMRLDLTRPDGITERRTVRKARDGEVMAFGLAWGAYVQPWTVVESDPEQ